MQTEQEEIKTLKILIRFVPPLLRDLVVTCLFSTTWGLFRYFAKTTIRVPARGLLHPRREELDPRKRRRRERPARDWHVVHRGEKINECG